MSIILELFAGLVKFIGFGVGLYIAIEIGDEIKCNSNMAARREGYDEAIKDLKEYGQYWDREKQRYVDAELILTEELNGCQTNSTKQFLYSLIRSLQDLME